MVGDAVAEGDVDGEAEGDRRGEGEGEGEADSEAEGDGLLGAGAAVEGPTVYPFVEVGAGKGMFLTFSSATDMKSCQIAAGIVPP